MVFPSDSSVDKVLGVQVTLWFWLRFR